jgi:porphobilinogen synthase
MVAFPNTRLRRNRKSYWLREMIAENSLSCNDLIQPFFVIEGNNLQQEIKSMMGIYRYSIDLLIDQAKIVEQLGIKAILLFPNIDDKLKSDHAEESYNDNNLICRAIRELKKHVNIGIIADVALDPYTSHGHDGILKDDDVDNDATIEILCKQALALSRAGCDIIAPSDMMDGRVGGIRKALDKEGFINTSILSYAAKFASNFYGPFRDAVGSLNNIGGKNKSAYQMDFRNSCESLREIELDIKEGADLIMIKPALAYLDIIYQAKINYDIPIIAYQVSGEYAMIKSAVSQGLLDNDKILLESLMAIKRAGASAIVSYAAMEVAILLCKKNH